MAARLDHRCSLTNNSVELIFELHGPIALPSCFGASAVEYGARKHLELGQFFVRMTGVFECSICNRIFVSIHLSSVRPYEELSGERTHSEYP